MDVLFITSPVNVTEPPISLSAPIPNTINVTCFGGSDGSATVNPVGGTPGYTYLWSDGQTTQTANNLTAGNYTCTVTDANGCPLTTSSVLITQPQTNITATISSNNISCHGGSDGSASVSATGGTPFPPPAAPYTYLWSDGQTTQTAINLTAGTYTCTIEDATSTGCGLIVTVTIIDPPELVIDSIIINPVTCSGQCDASVLSIQASGGTPYTLGYSYLYSVNGGLPHPNISYFNGYCAGTYTVEVSDVNNCYNQEILIIEEPLPLSVSVLPPPNFLWNNYQIRCNGNNSGFANIIVSGGVSPATLTVLEPNGNIFYDTVSNYLDTLFEYVDDLTAGVYTFNVTDSNGCTFSETITYSEPDQIMHHLFASHVTCSGWNNGSILDSVSGGVGNGVNTYTYQWYDENGIIIVGETSNVIDSVATGYYIVKATDANNCHSQDTVLINDYNALDASIIGTDVSCFNYCDGEITINAFGGVPNYNSAGNEIYSYQWNDTLFQTTQTAVGLCVDNSLFSTTYECVVTDVQGCSVTLSESIGQPTQLNVTASLVNDVLCFNESSGELDASGLGGSASKDISWILGCSTISKNINWTLSCLDTLKLQYRVLGTVNWLTIPLNNPGTSFILTGLSSNTRYEWRVKCQGSSWYGIPINTFTTGGAYIVQYRTVGASTWNTVDGNNTVSSPYTLTGLIPNTNYEWRVKCQGTAWAGIPINTFTTSYQYMWSNNAPNYSNNSSNSSLFAGDYVITIRDSEGCTASDFITLIQPTELSLAISDTDVTCFGFNNGKIVSVAENGTPFLGIPPEYLYTVTNQSTGASVYSEKTPVGLVDSLNPGIYTIIAEDRNGCTIQSGTIYISEPGDSSIMFNTVDASCLQNNGSASIVVYGGTPSYQYSWDNNVVTANNTNLSAGYYPITITDSKG